MARVRGQLEFPIDEVKNPALAKPEDGPFGFKLPNIGNQIGTRDPITQQDFKSPDAITQEPKTLDPIPKPQ